MQTSATINIYVQALGGKFLGPNAYKTDNIQVSLAFEENTVPVTYQLFDKANDGEIGPTFIGGLSSSEAMSSFLPILTPMPDAGSNPAVNYLTPNALTIRGTVAVSLSQSTAIG